MLKRSKNIFKNSSKNEGRLVIYFRMEKERDRFIIGDGYLIPFIRRIIKGKKISGVGRVFVNLCHSFNLLGIKYMLNLPFNKLQPKDRLIVLGLGKYALEGYLQENKIVAGIALMTHPSEWPNLCEEYPIAKYLQHSDWAKKLYEPYYGKDVCDTWFAGIDTERWKPREKQSSFDVLIYNKIRWEYDKYNSELRIPIIEVLAKHGLSYREIVYGKYKEEEYHQLLSSCKLMIFLVEHESQGFACCEAMSMNIPILAWDQGYCLDPNRFDWNAPVIPATSVPFFNEQCGMTFKDFDDFNHKFDDFISHLNANKFHPRDFVINHLSLEKSGRRMLEILDQVYQ